MTVKRWIFLAIIILGLTACEGSPDVTDLRVGRQSQTWIDAPLPNSTIPLLPYNLMFHGADASGIAEFEVLVNGELITKVLLSSSNVNETLYFGEFLWTPAAPGTYLIEVKAIGNEEGASSDQVYVTVRDEEEGETTETTETQETSATATPTTIPVPIATNTPIPADGQIRVHLYIDTNSNGIEDRTDADYRNVRVSLRPGSCSGRLSESHHAITNDNGNVLFSNLNYGPYCVTTDSGFTPTTTYPVNVNINSPALITVNIGYSN